jgi:hypothetical protein
MIVWVYVVVLVLERRCRKLPPKPPLVAASLLCFTVVQKMTSCKPFERWVDIAHKDYSCVPLQPCSQRYVTVKVVGVQVDWTGAFSAWTLSAATALVYIRQS